MDSQNEKCPDCGTPLDSNKLTCPGCGRGVGSLLSTQPPASGISGPEPSVKRIGEFRILRTIGRGGMGTVYEVYQESMRRKVALKVLDSSLVPSMSELTRFEREAWIAGRLSHPNIVRVHSQGVEDDKHFIAMELIEGESLHAAINKARARRQEPHISDSDWRREHIRKMVTLFIGVADALEHVHQQGIVHRDIKPPNLLLTKDDSRLLLTDFGLARDEEASRMTRRGDFLGTVRYMSPEQLLAHRTKIDRRSDIWSMGVSLYEAITLELPYTGDSEEAYINAVSVKEPVPARRRFRGVSRDLETILMKCLQRDPKERFQTAREFRDDLGRWLGGIPVLASRPSLATKSWRLLMRNWRVATAAFLVASTSAVLSGLYLSHRRRQVELDRVRWTLEEAIRKQTTPDLIQPDWRRLQQLMEKDIAEHPFNEIGRLALISACRVRASPMPSFSLAAKPPTILFEYGKALKLSSEGLRKIRKQYCAGEIQASWDGGVWQDLGWYYREFPSSDSGQNSYNLGTMVSDVRRMSGPHRLELRVKLHLYDRPPMLGVTSMFGGGLLSDILEGKQQLGALRPVPHVKPAFSTTLLAGSQILNLYGEYEPDFPRIVVGTRLEHQFRIDRVRIGQIHLPPGKGRLLRYESPLEPIIYRWCLREDEMNGMAVVSEVELLGKFIKDPPTPLAGTVRLAVGSSGEVVEFPMCFAGRDATQTGGCYSARALAEGAYISSIHLLQRHWLDSPLADGMNKCSFSFRPSREVARSFGVETFLGSSLDISVEAEVSSSIANWEESPECQGQAGWTGRSVPPDHK